MCHQSQATKVHVVYCFFIARPVLLQVPRYGVHKPDLTSFFFEARATVPKCYLYIIHGQAN